MKLMVQFCGSEITFIGGFVVVKTSLIWFLLLRETKHEKIYRYIENI